MEARAMNSIPQEQMQVETKITDFLKEYGVGNLLYSVGARKTTGFAVLKIFAFVFGVLFTNRSAYMQMLLAGEKIAFHKDTLYRFLNSCHTNWRRFTILLASRIISKTIEPLTSSERRNVFIIDDSFFSRSRSKKVELLAKVYDHAHGIYANGYRMLTLGWSDGNSFLPLSYCQLSTENAANRINEASSKIDPRTSGGRQRKMAQQKATTVILTLLKEAVAHHIPAKHVLFDTWFCSPSSLIAIKALGLDVIAMAKKSPKMLYKINGIKQSAMQIYKQHRKRPGKSKYLLSVDAAVEKDGKSQPVRLVYVRNRNKKTEYLVLVTTDMTLSPEEIIQLYGKRWNIEVFFKVCKSYLWLEKDCRALSYDAITAHTAIVFARYMLFAVEERRSKDDRTIGELFYLCIDELADIKYQEALRLILVTLVELADSSVCITSSSDMKMLIQSFMNDLPEIWTNALKKCA